MASDVGCSSSDDPDDSIIVGRYAVAQPSCFQAGTFDLANEPDGSLTFTGPPVVPHLNLDGAGYHSVTGYCSVQPGSGTNVHYVLYYQEVRITPSSSGWVHVELNTASQVTDQDGCTTEAALALKGATCEFEARIAQPAPMITGVNPEMLLNSDCTQELTLRGNGFSPEVRVEYRYISYADYNGMHATDVGDLVLSQHSSTTVAAALPACPRDPSDMPFGDISLEVVNADGQADYATVVIKTP